MVRLAIFALVFALAFSACGGGDDSKDAQQAVRDFVEATNDHDGDRLCEDLLSQDYLEKYTGATGDRADDACKQQLSLITGLRLRLVSIDRTEVDDDTATVRATIAMRGERTPRVFRLVKQDGDWKLDSGS
jgi:Domain of unknown function (DUF4878)